MSHPLFARLHRRIREIQDRHGLDLQDVVHLVSMIEAQALMPSGERYRHEKRGTTYDVYGVGHTNSSREVRVSDEDYPVTTWSREKVLLDRDEVVIYRDVQSGAISVRGVPEFLDGRFALLPPAAGAPAPDPQRALSRPSQPPAGSQAAPAQAAPSSSSEPTVVEYVGPMQDRKGRVGDVIEWDAAGRVRIRWRDSIGSVWENPINLKFLES
jgi:hypothetical protein